MANLVNSLFKIDAAEGLVRYTNTVKPYHSKILDVLIEYVYKEDIRVKVKEGWNWNVAIDKTPNRCVFDVIESSSVHKQFIITGHHQERFLAGSRFVYTGTDGATGVYIIGSTANSIVVSPTDLYTTAITTVTPRAVPTIIYNNGIVAGTVQIDITPQYRIIGAASGIVSPSWIVEGDVTTDFIVGEQLIVADAAPHNPDASIYTITNTTLGYAPNVDVRQTPSTEYTIVGVTPTRLGLTGTILYPGQWIINGSHAGKFVVGSHFNVSNPSGGSYVVASAINTRYEELNLMATSVIASFGIDRLTVVTILPTQEIPPAAPPVGVLTYPALPKYEIVGVPPSQDGWIIAGHYDTRFVTNDVFFVTDNTDSPSNSQYFVETAVYNSTLNTTTIYIKNSSMSVSAQPNGIVTHSTRLSTIISVTEPIFAALSGYKAFGTGTLRYIPRIATQIVEPTSPIVGMVWVNPVTNVSKRWESLAGWVHNYTSTNYSWGLGSAQPAQLIVTSAVSQIDSPLLPLYSKSNSFVVDTTTSFGSFAFTTVSTQSNEFMFSQSYAIIGVDSSTNRWIVTGVVDVIPGESIYITSSTNRQGLGKYVVSHTNQLTSTTTEIFVTKQISRLASADGHLSVPTNISNVPHWVEGTRVKVSSTMLLPNPLLTQHVYYFIPVIAPFVGVDENGNDVETPAVFALSTTRHPHGYDDYVDVTTFGAGVLTITQDELYVPGSQITITDSFMSRNNGDYTILNAINETSTTTRLFVKQRVKSTTPATSTNDGVLTYDLDSHVYSSLTRQDCGKPDRSELYVASSITEYIEFVFSMDVYDHIGTSVYENEPTNTNALSAGFDLPSYDISGYDGDLTLSTNRSSFGSMGGSSVHSIFPMGFDTQFFGMGGLDENTSTVSKYYGRSA